MKKISLLALIAMLSACSILPEKTLSGTYEGTLPCVDCKKIQAKLILNHDKTYQYHTVYFKRKEQHPFTERGTYQWDQQKPDVLRLHASKVKPNDKLPDMLFKVSETYIERCDPQGNVMDNAQYRLMKVQP